LVFEKNANSFAENWRKSQKIVIITSTPGHPAHVPVRDKPASVLMTISIRVLNGETPFRPSQEQHYKDILRENENLQKRIAEVTFSTFSVFLLENQKSGLPGGLFSNQKSQFG
jgi:hypothetical protein